MFRSCAILGATGLVGQEILKIMNNDKSFAFENLFLYSSSSSRGIAVEYKGRKITVKPFDEKNIPLVDIVFSSIDESLSKKYVPQFLTKGSCVIDDSSAFRLDKSSALVLYGINDNLITKKQKLYSQPNCVVVGIAYPVNLISKVYKIKRIYVSTYQSISGAGRKSMEDFTQNLKNYINDKPIKLNVFNNDPVLNAIAVIPDSDFKSQKLSGFTKEEEKLLLETRKILDANLVIVSTCVRISAIRGHSASVFVELTEQPVLSKISRIFARSEFIEFDNHKIFTPKDVVGKDKVYICRLRSLGNILCFWATWDNLRIGSALNMWRIFKKLLEQYTKINR